MTNRRETLQMILGHVGRLLVCVLAPVLAHWGLSAAEADAEATHLATALCALAGAVVSTWWSVRSRRKLLAESGPGAGGTRAQ